MLLEVISANYLRGYKVFVTFNNGYQATVDLEETILHDHRPIFRPLRDRAYFQTLAVKLNTICWDNAADFAPEFLYALAQQQAQEASVIIQKAA